MVFPFEPTALPLLLGSLPYRNPAQALHISRHYVGAIVAWPQLWQRSFREQGVVQSASGFPGLIIDEHNQRVYVERDSIEIKLNHLALAYLENNITEAELTENDAAGFAELLRQRDSMSGVMAVKGQQLGPISLAMQLTDQQQQPVIHDPAIFDALTQFLRLRASWQEQRLAELERPTIICLDEPFLEMIGSPFLPLDWDEARARMEEVLAGIDGCKALFASGAVDWGQILRTSVEMVIADVYEHSASLLGAAEALDEFLERDGIVGLGIVPFDAEELVATSPSTLVARVNGLVAELERAGVNTERLVQQVVITPSGPLGMLDSIEAERALKLVRDVSHLLREQYGFQ
jgi:hypothetical protein